MLRRIDSQTAEGVAGRDRVNGLAGTDPRAALTAARANPHPWYRCQSLARVAAEIADESKATSILREALAAAREQEEPNRIVSVSAWPISILVRRSLCDVSHIVGELLAIIGREPNPVRRGDALLMLLEAVIRDRSLRRTVLEPLLQACAEGRGWKSRRTLQFAALALAVEDPEAALDVARRIPESRQSRRAKKMLEQRERLGAHAFVPYYVKE